MRDVGGDQGGTMLPHGKILAPCQCYFTAPADDVEVPVLLPVVHSRACTEAAVTLLLRAVGVATALPEPDPAGGEVTVGSRMCDHVPVLGDKHEVQRLRHCGQVAAGTGTGIVYDGHGPVLPRHQRFVRHGGNVRVVGVAWEHQRGRGGCVPRLEIVAPPRTHPVAGLGSALPERRAHRSPWMQAQWQGILGQYIETIQNIGDHVSSQRLRTSWFVLVARVPLGAKDPRTLQHRVNDSGAVGEAIGSLNIAYDGTCGHVPDADVAVVRVRLQRHRTRSVRDLLCGVYGVRDLLPTGRPVGLAG